jgi:hypothetical protein
MPRWRDDLVPNPIDAVPDIVRLKPTGQVISPPGVDPTLALSELHQADHLIPWA